MPVETIVNFGPNPCIAGGVCRQTEGIDLDPEENLYLASNSDAATSVGNTCVLDSKGDLINPRTHEVATISPALPPQPFAEDERGNFYVTDSLLGRIYKFTSEPDSDTVWLEHPARLSTNPNPNIGANDLAFDAQRGLPVCNQCWQPPGPAYFTQARRPACRPDSGVRRRACTRSAARPAQPPLLCTLLMVV